MGKKASSPSWTRRRCRPAPPSLRLRRQRCARERGGCYVGSPPPASGVTKCPVASGHPPVCASLNFSCRLRQDPASDDCKHLPSAARELPACSWVKVCERRL